MDRQDKMDIPTPSESIVLEIVPSQAVVIDGDNSQDQQQQQQQQQKRPTVTFRDEVDVSTISDVESDTDSVEAVDSINNIVESSSDQDIKINNNNEIDEQVEQQKQEIISLRAVSRFCTKINNFFFYYKNNSDFCISLCFEIKVNSR